MWPIPFHRRPVHGLMQPVYDWIGIGKKADTSFAYPFYFEIYELFNSDGMYERISPIVS